MERKKQIVNFIFSIAFLLMITVPLCLLKTEPEIASKLENRNLTEWPGLHFSAQYNEWYGHYAEDRIGFRNEAIRFYNLVSYYVFGEFAENIHMEGKDGYIFPADDGYIKNYQRINISTDLLDDLTLYAKRTSEYARENGADFYLMVCPNKSSVYGQYMPSSIHVNEAEKTALDIVRDDMTKAGISFVIPDREFREKSKTEQIYNVKYDCAHWNDLGAFYGLRLLDEKIAEKHPDIPILSKDSFSLEYQDIKLELTSLSIHDQIPVLTLPAAAVSTDSPDRKDVPVVPGNNLAYFYNSDALSDKTILILHDSFLDNRESWYYGRYREVYYGSRVNYTNMKDYIDIIQPDIIVFELAERSFADDLYAYTELGSYQYY